MLAVGLANPRKHPKIYVQHLPSVYNDELFREGCAHREGAQSVLEPFGPSVVGSNGKPLWLQDCTYCCLETYFHQQMLTSPLRTLTATSADIVYVPLYAMAAAYMNANSSQPIIAKFWQDISELLPLLDSIPHFIVVPGVQHEVVGAACGGWHSQELLCHPSAKKLFWMIQETCSDALGPNLVHIPYAAHNHWLIAERRTSLRLADKMLAASMVVGRVMGVREDILRHCVARPDECQAIVLDGLEARKQQQWVVDMVDLHARSWFCLTPPGDTRTRQGLFDCIAAASIPVIFDPLLVKQLPFGDMIDYRSLLVLVEPHQLRHINLIDKLLEVSERQLQLMVGRLTDLARLFQYAVNPDHMLISFDQMHHRHELDDAFTYSMKSLLRQITS